MFLQLIGHIRASLNRHFLGAALFATAMSPAFCQTITRYELDTDSLQISAGGTVQTTFLGNPFRAVVEGDVARFYIAGDLTLPPLYYSDPQLTNSFFVLGSRPASIVVGGDLISPASPVVIDGSSPDSQRPGPGGGWGGAGGDGGAKGTAGEEGNWTRYLPLGGGGGGGDRSQWFARLGRSDRAGE